MTSTPVLSNDAVRVAVNDIADQLCGAVNGDFDFSVDVPCDDESVQKLKMLVNFVLDMARRSLASVKEREALQAAIFEFAVEGIITIDETGVIQACNSSAANIFGYEADEIVGQNVSLLMPEPHREAHDSYLSAYLNGGRGRVIGAYRELDGVRADGTVIPLELAVSEVHAGGKRRFTGIVRDLTENKREETLLLQQSRRAALAGEIGIALTQADSQTTMLRLCCDAIVRLLDVQGAMVLISNAGWGTLEVAARAGDGLDASMFERHAGRAGGGERLCAGEALSVEAETNDTTAQWPLAVEGRTLGLLVVASDAPLSEATHATISAAADAIAVGILRKITELSLDDNAQRQRAVAALSKRALAGADLQDLFSEAAACVAQVLDAEVCGIFTRDLASESLTLSAGVGWRAGEAPVATVYDSDLGRTVLTGSPSVVVDLDCAATFHPSTTFDGAEPVCGVHASIRAGDRPLGALAAYALHRHRRFGDDDVGFMQGVADALAQAVQRKNAEEQLDERRRLASLCAAVGVAMNGSDDVRTVLQNCAEVLVSQLDAAFARIWTLNEAEHVLELEASAGMYTHIDGGHARVPVGKFKIGLIAEEREPHLTNQVVGDPRVGDQEWAKREGMVAFAGYPLVCGDRLVGVMAVFARHELSQAVLSGLAAVSETIAMGVARCHAAHDLRVSEERYDLATHGSSAGIWGWDFSTQDAYYSPHCKRLLGFEVDDQLESTLRDVALRIHQADRRPVVEAFRRHLSHRTPLDIECRLRTKCGEYRWFRGHGQAVWDESGNPLRVAGSLTDITSQKAAEFRRNARLAVTQALASAPSTAAAAQRTLQALCDCLDWSVGVLWRVDAESSVLECASVLHHGSFPANRFKAVTYRTAFGCGEGLPGRAWQSRSAVWIRDVVAEPQYFRAGVAADNGLRAAFAFPILSGSDVVAVFELYSTQVREKDIDLLDMIASVSGQVGLYMERAQAERELRSAHTETQQLLASISSVLVSLDQNLCVTKWNSVAERAFGIPSSAVLGTAFSDCPIAWRDADIVSHVAARLTAADAAQFDELWFTAPDGQDHVLRLSVNPVRTEDDIPAGLLLLGTDVTDQHALETQLRQAQKLESIGQLAAGIAHEINTPVQFVSDNARFLQESFAAINDLLVEYDKLAQTARTGSVDAELLTRIEAARELAELDFLAAEIPPTLAQSLDGLDRVASIVGAMKDFSHPGSETKTLSDVNRCVESTAMVARNEWKYVAELKIDADPNLPLVPCFPGDLNQVILNLIVNASHAVADANKQRGGGKGQICVSTRMAGDCAEIRIADSGTGIPIDAQSRVFDPFFTTKRVGKGTGQGLAIAHSVVTDKHGGSISFETEAGRGTTFIIRLPLD